MARACQDPRRSSTRMRSRISQIQRTPTSDMISNRFYGSGQGRKIGKWPVLLGWSMSYTGRGYDCIGKGYRHRSRNSKTPGFGYLWSFFLIYKYLEAIYPRRRRKQGGGCYSAAESLTKHMHRYLYMCNAVSDVAHLLCINVSCSVGSNRASTPYGALVVVQEAALPGVGPYQVTPARVISCRG